MENTDLTAVTMPLEDTGGAIGTADASPSAGGTDTAFETEALPKAGEECGTNEPSGDGLQASAFCLPVKFNKQDYHLSLEEATAYAQKGMKFDTIEPMLDKLKTLAQSHGLGVRELVDTLCDGTESVSTEERLAEEFCRLREECPDVTAFDAVPETVVKTALDEGISLLDAYLRYEHRERVRVQQAADAARKAGAASAGAQRSELTPVPDPAVEAMLSGVRG